MTESSKNIKQINIFIDTNIYLDYFRMSSVTLASLEELLKLLKGKKLKLILPQQVDDEYWRDKNTIIEEMRKNIENKLPGSLELPTPVRNLPTIKEGKELYLECRKKIFEAYDNEFKTKATVEKLIESIFEKAEYVKDDKNIIQNAYYRYLKGNPPGKKNSYGDAITWETLLSKFTNNDLVIITYDIDWYADKNRKNFNELLVREWKSKTKNKISIKNSLGEFINEFKGEKTIKKEIIEEEKTIQYYPSFDTTVSTGTITNSWVSSPVSYIDSVTITSPRIHCPFCNKDITTELENDFPELKERYNPLTITSNYLVSGILWDKIVQCPYCKKSFNLNNI